jgi:hypothetical protein
MMKAALPLSMILIVSAIVTPVCAGDLPPMQSTPGHNVYVVPKHLSKVEKFAPKTGMMNILELRDCMKLEASNKARLAELDRKADESEKERQRLVAAGSTDKQAEAEWKKRYDVLLKEDDELNESRQEYFMDCARRQHKVADEDTIKAEQSAK